MDQTTKRLRGPHATKPGTALLLIDFINDLEFPEGPQLEPYAFAAAQATARLVGQARRLAVPVIYVNDNFGRWQSQFDQAVRHCGRQGSGGRRLVQKLKPRRSDYFVLKPKHSGFYMTPLSLLLESLQIRRLILTGLLADSCVLFTANDAYLRGYKLVVPEDCTASIDVQHAQQALEYMHRMLKADTRRSSAISLHPAARRLQPNS